MGQREDVRDSLLRGDSRDGVARRRVADQVKAVVMTGTDGRGESVATAASGVVLASDLRAPIDASHLPTRIEPDGEVVAVPAPQCLEDPFRPCVRCLACRQDAERVCEALAEVRALLAGEGQPAAPSFDRDDWKRILTWYAALDGEGYSDESDWDLRDRIEPLAGDGQ